MGKGDGIVISGGSRNSKLGWPDPHLFLLFFAIAI